MSRKHFGVSLKKKFLELRRIKFHLCSFKKLSYLNSFNDILNGAHTNSRTYSNAIPHAGLNVLSSLDIFDGRDSLQAYINIQMRDLVFRGLDLRSEIDSFIDGLSIDLDSLLYQYTACYRSLPIAFDYESAADLASIRLCYSD